MKNTIFFLLLFNSMFLMGQEQIKNLYRTESGHVKFVSDAPLEFITAESDELKGIVNADDQNFAFQMDIKTLEGFNSPLQQEHFYENYMETEKYPKAAFSGKIIEKVDFSQPGEVKVRAKGELNIHGVKKERIINCMLKIGKNEFTATSDFTVMLEDHNISIPKLVYQKIAEEIKVSMTADFQKIETEN
ncbi:MAG: YceI family protein [Bacteroidales bacterium]|nr:YceI family protein [Bacteroidales bacterium]